MFWTCESLDAENIILRHQLRILRLNILRRSAAWKTIKSSPLTDARNCCVDFFAEILQKVPSQKPS